MPWKNVLPMDEKLRFISLYGTDRSGADRFGSDRFGSDRFGSDRFGMAELCREFVISSCLRGVRLNSSGLARAGPEDGAEPEATCSC